MKALITGASSGIGREFARLLAARGWDLIVAARSTDKLYELRDELSNVHVRVITIDLSREQDAYDLYEHLQEEHIDMLINNAGFGAYGFFADVPLQREIELIHTTAVPSSTSAPWRAFRQVPSCRATTPPKTMWCA